MGEGIRLPCLSPQPKRRLEWDPRGGAPPGRGPRLGGRGSQMGTPQEDESIFAILVAGDTPNNLHQDKLGEYVR